MTAPDPGLTDLIAAEAAVELRKLAMEHRHTADRLIALARRADTHPLATITAGGNHHGIATLTSEGPRFRMLNNRECARGQGFPDTYEFVGNAKDVKKQIGNAVSVDAARWIGGRLKAALGVAA